MSENKKLDEKLLNTEGEIVGCDHDFSIWKEIVGKALVQCISLTENDPSHMLYKFKDAAYPYQHGCFYSCAVTDMRSIEICIQAMQGIACLVAVGTVSMWGKNKGYFKAIILLLLFYLIICKYELC